MVLTCRRYSAHPLRYLNDFEQMIYQRSVTISTIIASILGLRALVNRLTGSLSRRKTGIDRDYSFYSHWSCRRLTGEGPVFQSSWGCACGTISWSFLNMFCLWNSLPRNLSRHSFCLKKTTAFYSFWNEINTHFLVPVILVYAEKKVSKRSMDNAIYRMA